MDGSVRKALMAAGAAAAIGSGIYFGTGISRAEDALMEEPAYQVVQAYKSVDRNLSSAQDELEYHSAYTMFIPVSSGKSIILIPIYHPADYPDCIDAAANLDEAVSWYHQAPESEDDYLAIELRIGSVRDSLPRENDIRTYRGENVRNRTFESQRNAIEDIREDIQARIEEYDSRVPEELKDGKTVAVTGLVLSLVAGLGLAGAGLLSNDDYSWPSAEMR